MDYCEYGNEHLSSVKDGTFLQNFWLIGLYPSSGILNNIKLKVSETVSVSVLRSVEGDTYSVGSLRKS
jgi:hypothetical protein